MSLSRSKPEEETLFKPDLSCRICSSCALETQCHSVQVSILAIIVVLGRHAFGLSGSWFSVVQRTSGGDPGWRETPSFS